MLAIGKMGWLWLTVAAVACIGFVSDAQSVVEITHAPHAGLFVGRIRAANLLSKSAGRASVLAMKDEAGHAIPGALVPSATGIPGEAMLICRLVHSGNQALKVVQITPSEYQAAALVPPGKTNGYALHFQPDSAHGSPSSVQFSSGLRLSNFAWNDRIYRPDRGGFMLRNDRELRATTLIRSELCTVVRVEGRYCDGAGKPAPGEAHAAYDWVMFPESASLFVSAEVEQKTPFAWQELHFLEFNNAGAEFTAAAGGSPNTAFTLKADKSSTVYSDHGLLTDGRNSLAFYRSPVTVYDGHGDYGTYLHAAWTPWESSHQHFDAWISITSGGKPEEPASFAAAEEKRLSLLESQQPSAGVAVSGGDIALHRAIQNSLDSTDRLKNWKTVLAGLAARRYLSEGDSSSATRLMSGAKPADVTLHFAHSGMAGLVLEQSSHGCRLLCLADLTRAQDLLAAGSKLFYTHIQTNRTGDSRDITGDAGWGNCSVDLTQTRASQKVVIHLAHPIEEHLTGLSATITAEPCADGWEWGLELQCPRTQLSVMRTDYPMLALAEPGPNAKLLVPVGCGQLKSGFWTSPSQYYGTYPSGWCAMQVAAAYAEAAVPQQSHGLYLAIHDPMGSVRDWRIDSDPAASAVNFRCQIPAPAMNNAANGFHHSGTVCTRILHGDWYDAAQIYGTWVRSSARWWNSGKSQQSAKQTPAWMKNLAVWLQMGGPVSDTVANALAFQKQLGTEIGLHWYNWHHNPFDNDYPHYLPARPGVAEGVKLLQAHGIHVMPYINGRLWDTRDDGLKDFEFTSKARPWVAKDGSKNLFTESYGSKETDGSDVKLGVMCPSSPLWKDTLTSLVKSITGELGTDAVYIDQVGAAPPVLCEDPSHPHAPGGGSWWNESYCGLIGSVRKQIGPEKALTTECNAEPFMQQFDGYLTWHWQYNGQVPVFPAVYSSQVRAFGRSYGGGKDRVLAFKMRCAQQLMFGEQLGWFDPSLALEPECFAFLKQAVELRSRYNALYTLGTMQRPPHPANALPEVTADWQWAGVDMVTNSALYTSEWKTTDGKSQVMMLANVTAQPITAVFTWGAGHGHPMLRLANGQAQALKADSASHQLKVTLAANSFAAIEELR
jgi:Domain of unknown function (DUF6259)